MDWRLIPNHLLGQPLLLLFHDKPISPIISFHPSLCSCRLHLPLVLVTRKITNLSSTQRYRPRPYSTVDRILSAHPCLRLKTVAINVHSLPPKSLTRSFWFMYLLKSRIASRFRGPSSRFPAFPAPLADRAPPRPCLKSFSFRCWGWSVHFRLEVMSSRLTLSAISWLLGCRLPTIVE
jgi:hypothetical protein